ncbi:MAG: polysaccharide biosynthesis protein, partial [Pseudomonadota bacterium]
MDFLRRLSGLGPKPANGPARSGADRTTPLCTDDLDLSALLGRSPRKIDQRAARRLISGKRVMITGAGGTIGSELVRQAIAFDPQHVVLVDNAEFNLYQIDLEIREHGHTGKFTSSLTDVCNQEH